ncbi:MAG TPA: protoporphyrinogen oxidase [Ornithinibacter sp.]|nr:protoporphyrinogen oxidase [Ornithinibacter sp.]
MRVADVVVVGGGISGLATAYWLAVEHQVDVVVVEAGDRAGGKVSTQALAGMPVDTGPDAFLSRGQDLAELVSRVGLADDVVRPLPGGAFIWSRGRLRPIPQGGAFGIPDRVLPLLRSRLLSPAGVLRAGLDFVRPRTTLPADPTVAQIVRPRLGDQVVERIVQPLLGGVHAGSVDRLSARSTVPDVVELAGSGRSLVLALRRRRRAAPKAAAPPAPPLVSLRGGLSRLVHALVTAVGEARVLRGSPVTAVRRTAAGWEVTTPHTAVLAREVVLAAPAHASAELVCGEAPELATELRDIEYAGVATVTLALPRGKVGEVVGTGFLVPPAEGALLVGCTWLTSKWPQLAEGDCVLLRCMVGRDGDQRWASMTDDLLVAAVRADLGRVMGLVATPTQILVQRWPRGIPQYVVGHAERLGRIDALLPAGLHLTGAGYRGSGLAACVASARRTATTVAARLPAPEDHSRPYTPDAQPDPSLQGATT